MTPIDQDLQPRQISIDSIFTRRQIRVSKILVHENFIDSITDLAILKLGKKNLSGDPFYKNKPSRFPIHRREGGSISCQPCLSS